MFEALVKKSSGEHCEYSFLLNYFIKKNFAMSWACVQFVFLKQMGAHHWTYVHCICIYSKLYVNTLLNTLYALLGLLPQNV